MSDKPPFDKLSDFGQCVANKHVNKGIVESAAKTAPTANASAEDKKSHEDMYKLIASSKDKTRDAVLETRGIDWMLTSPESVSACSNKIPPNTPRDIEGLKKAARAPRT